MVGRLKQKVIDINERTLYNSLEQLSIDEKQLENTLSKTDVKMEKVIYIPYAIHLMKERKRLKGLKFKDKIQLKVLLAEFKIMKRKLKRMGVKVE